MNFRGISSLGLLGGKHLEDSPVLTLRSGSCPRSRWRVLPLTPKAGMFLAFLFQSDPRRHPRSEERLD